PQREEQGENHVLSHCRVPFDSAEMADRSRKRERRPASVCPSPSASEETIPSLALGLGLGRRLRFRLGRGPASAPQGSTASRKAVAKKAAERPAARYPRGSLSPVRAVEVTP